jgi:IS1 family transposase
MEKAVTAIKLLMEGNSIRSICRIVRLGQHTVLNLLRKVGEGCERLQGNFVRGVTCQSIQCDELWSYVYCKERTRIRKGYREDELGDCYTWTGLDSSTKLILAFAVGKRDPGTAAEFTRKLRRATAGRFQINTDGLATYRHAIWQAFGIGQDHAQVIKIFGGPREGESRYSPPQIVDIFVQVGGGNPDLRAASTSHVERSNLTFRMMLRRFTRLTNGHSKSWDHHKAVISLFVFFYNFCRKHMTLKQTPAMAAGLTHHVWTVRELIESAIIGGNAAVA